MTRRGKTRGKVGHQNRRPGTKQPASPKSAGEPRLSARSQIPGRAARCAAGFCRTKQRAHASAFPAPPPPATPVLPYSARALNKVHS